MVYSIKKNDQLEQRVALLESQLKASENEKKEYLLVKIYE